MMGDRGEDEDVMGEDSMVGCEPQWGCGSLSATLYI